MSFFRCLAIITLWTFFHVSSFAKSPIVTTLSHHLDKFPASSHTTSWSCLNLEHVLTQIYISFPSPTRSIITMTQTPAGTDLTQNIFKALQLCSRPNHPSSEYPSIFRLMLAWDIARGDLEAFLTHYLTQFHPYTPKHLVHHKILLQDLRRLPLSLKKQKAYQQATALLRGVLDPFQLPTAKSLFSPVFYGLLESQIWKIHFEYERSFQILKNISGYWLNPDFTSEDITQQLRPLEIQHLENRLKYMLNSNHWVLSRLEWLSQRINTPEVKKAVTQLSIPFQSKSRSSDNIEEKWKEVKILWNNHQTPTAISEAKAYIQWHHRLPPRLRHTPKTKDMLSTAYIALAQMYLETGNRQKAFSTFDKAQHLCENPHSSCFLPYHRELSLAYIMAHQYEQAWNTLTTLTDQADLEEYDKQEYYFWTWVVSRYLQKDFSYSFPYLTPYRPFASCIANSRGPKPNRISNTLPKSKKEYAILTPEDLAPFLDKKQNTFLQRALLTNEYSDAVNHFLRNITYQILDQMRRGHAPLSTPKLMTLAKILQKHDLYVEAIDILFEFSRQTPVQDLPRAFYTHFFPNRFQQDALSSSAMLKLPPALINAFIRRESLFDPMATSPAYALGLMQVLPETARRVAKSGRIPYQHVSNGNVGLFQPQSNVRIGAQYLHDLLQYFAGNLIYTTASYNAGEHRVIEWVKRLDGIKDSPLLFIENIPYKETRFYVKWVLLYYFYYLQLNGNKKISPSAFCKYAQNPLPTPMNGARH